MASKYSKRPRCFAWNYMKKISPSEVQCQICQKVLKWFQSTSTLNRHLQSIHSLELGTNLNETNETNESIESETEGTEPPKPLAELPSTSTTLQVEPKLTPKRSRSWAYMKKISDTQVQCQICKKVLQMSYSKSTTTLNRHLRSKHPEEYAASLEETEEVEIPKKTGHFQAEASWRKPLTFRADKKVSLDQLVVSMICTDMQPLSVLENKGFKKLVHALNPKYVLPNRQDISSRLLPKLYKEHRDLLQKELNDISSVSMTVDLWSSQKTEGFITVTAHFLTKEWDLRSVVLETARIGTVHTAEKIADELWRIFSSWNISEKVACIVADNASNMSRACNILNIPWVPCFAHTLNLVVQDAMKNISDFFEVRKKIKETVTFFHHNVEASNKLENLQVNQGKTPLKLKQDMATRWNSTFYMLQRFIEIQIFVTEALYSFGRPDLVVDNVEMETLNLHMKALLPIEVATKEMSEEKFTTLSKVMPMVKNLTNYLDQLTQSSGSDLAKELSTQLRGRFSGLENEVFPASATLLDPRFKKMAFTNQANCQSIETLLQGMIKSNDPHNEPQTELTETTAKPSEESSMEPCFWSSFDLVVEKAAKPTNEPMVEFHKYYDVSIIRRHEDPFLWWKEREIIFPQLHVLAKQFMSVPATSVPPKRLFSKAGQEISSKRTSLKEGLVDKILFLNKSL